MTPQPRWGLGRAAMPLLKGTASYTRFRAELSDERNLTSDFILEGLRLHAFQPIAVQGEDERSAGFVEIEKHDSVDFPPSSVFQDDWMVFAWRIDTIRISAAQLREELAAWAQNFEGEHERAPSRFEKAEAKDALRRELRSVTPPATKTFDVSWNMSTGAVQVFSLSRKVVDEIQTALEKTFSCRLIPRSPLVLFDEAGLSEASMKPTPELCWPGMSADGH